MKCERCLQQCRQFLFMSLNKIIALFLNAIIKISVMKKSFFRWLNKVNKAILPKLSNKDPNSLTKIQKGILAYRYYVLVNSLD